MAETRELPANHVRPMPERLVLGQDTATIADEPAVDSGALRDAAEHRAHQLGSTEEINR